MVRLRRAAFAAFALIALVAGASAAAPEEDEGVWVLHDNDFDKHVNSEKIVLVEFYAPCVPLIPCLHVTFDLQQIFILPLGLLTRSPI